MTGHPQKEVGLSPSFVFSAATLPRQWRNAARNTNAMDLLRVLEGPARQTNHRPPGQRECTFDIAEDQDRGSPAGTTSGSSRSNIRYSLRLVLNFPPANGTRRNVPD